MLEIGSLVDGKYKILNKVGQGGMSVVYLAMNEKANKQWAVKEVRKDGVLDFESVKQGLVAETDILKKLDHPNLPSIIDVIDTEDSFIIIMDYIQGNSLNKALDEYGAQPQDLVIEWSKQLCDVLGYLHSRTPAIIYRDMKPSNVMLKPDGNVTLIDFGTAREYKEKNLADTTCLGTIGYAAPEQFGGMGQTDGRTDIYCLGATMYHLVTGMNPCEPPYTIKPIREIDPSLSSGLEKIILKCTQRDPNDRYQSCAELMYALEHYEDIDDVHIRAQKKKLGAFITTCALTLAFAATSVFGYVSASKINAENYSTYLAQAESMTVPEKPQKSDPDYQSKLESYVEQIEEIAEKHYQAIDKDPARVDAYTHLDKLLTADYVITSEEAEALKKLKDGFDIMQSNGTTKTVRNPIDKVKAADSDAYMDLCFKIGQSLLYYSKGEARSTRFDRANWWMEQAKEKYSAAAIYVELYECLTKIDQHRQNTDMAQLSAMRDAFSETWNRIVALEAASASFESPDFQINAWKEIDGMLSENVTNFIAVSSAKDIVALYDGMIEKATKINDSFLAEEVKELTDTLETNKYKFSTSKSN